MENRIYNNLCSIVEMEIIGKTYVHEEEVHNLESPSEIVPIIIELLKPNSVVDVGCGLGTFLYCFKKQGVNQVKGIDGSWVDRNLLYKYLSSDEFIEANLQTPIQLNEKYDIALSLEVAEHLSLEAANTFINNLVELSDTVVFSAAIPKQGGQNHINEQWLSYWVDIFNQHGYKLYDILRPLLWEKKNIFWWYKQNMVIFSKRNLKAEETNNIRIIDFVHPELFNIKTNQLTLKEKYILDIWKGQIGITFAFKILIKSIINKFKLYNF